MLFRFHVFSIVLAFSFLTYAYANPGEEDLFKDHVLKRDPLSVILQHVDWETAPKVRAVCKGWKSVADQQIVTHNPVFYKTADLDEFFFHGNFPQEQLTAIFLNQDQTVKRRFWERLMAYGRVLLKNRQALESLENTDFVRLLNLSTFQKTSFHFNPFHLNEANNLTMFIDKRRKTVGAWNNSTQKAEAYSTLCTYSKDPNDLEQMYELFMQVSPSNAAQILMKHVSDDEAVRIIEFHQRKVWNAAPRVETQKPLMVSAMEALGSIIGFFAGF